MYALIGAATTTVTLYILLCQHTGHACIHVCAECLGPEHPNSQEPSAGAAGTNGLNTQNSDGSRSNGDKLTGECKPKLA